MIKSGIDQDALIDMFAEASAKQGEKLRKAVADATLKALQGRELSLENVRKVIKTGEGMLMAPQSGKRTRAKLYRQGAEWREQAADTMGDAMASAGDKARQITHDVSKAS